MVYTAKEREIFVKKFFEYIEQKNNIVITAHISPDDDSIGSVLSLFNILNTKYPQKNIEIFYTGDIVARYNSFTDYKHIRWVSDVAEHLETTEALVVLDVSGYARISKHPEQCMRVPVRIAIDHHSSPPDEFTLACIDNSFSSNSELLYTLFSEEGDLTKDQAEYYLLGILGDTGNFAFINKQKVSALSVAQRCIIAGDISVDSFLSRFRAIPRRLIPVLQEFVKNTTFETITEWPPVQYSYVDRSFLEVHDFSDEDMSAASHIYLGQYLPRIEGYSWGFVISPRTDGACRMSSRSQGGSVNVRVFHEQMGVGGGHDRAAGAQISEKDSVVAIEKVKEWMRSHTPPLD